MIKEEIKSRLEDLFEDEGFIEKVEAAETAEEMEELFKENGVDLSADKVKDCLISVGGAGEISEDTLENVAGGYVRTYIPKPFDSKKKWEAIKKLINTIFGK